LKLLYDARMVDPQRVHGIARYTYELVNWALQHRPEHSIAVLTPNPQAWAHMPGLECILSRSKPFTPREQWELPGLIASARPDLVHFPSLAAPVLCPRPYVINAHDLIPWHFPASRFHRPYLATLTRWACWRARHVLSGSHHAAAEAHKILWVRSSKITVIPHGGLEEVSVQSAAAQGGRPYLLCVTNPRPHKNLEIVLQAFPQLHEAFDLKVVCADCPALQQACERFSQIERLSGISDEQLASLYQGAQAVIVPSLYEGFGLPALEAMQRGAPVISSSATSLPEVVGEAGLYFDPNSVAQLVHQVRRLGQDSALRQSLIEKGRIQARRFSWDRTAKEHWQVYEQLTMSARTIISMS